MDEGSAQKCAGHKRYFTFVFANLLGLFLDKPNRKTLIGSNVICYFEIIIAAFVVRES